MSVQPGETLSHYRLIEKIGEGGMGVVWKAVDTKLGREVAIKILPQPLVADRERLARFEREAKVLASLNHSNIATVYGLHEEGDIRFIAMELAPGEDLARRLNRGAMPLEEVLELGRQISEALEAAHEHGVIHRDLKPANVRVGEAGTVKVLDFGLAKASSGEPSGTDPSLSPTVTSGGTQAGVILGTAAYMSPEQARGRPVDRRSDVWAFGCLLYECLTGRKAFPGETISDTLAAVLKSDPDWAALPAATPEPLRRLLRRCLAKDPQHRLSSLGDARLEFEEASEEPAPAPTPSRSPARWLPWVVLSIVAGAAVIVLAIMFAGGGASNSEGAISYKRLTHQRGWIRQARIAPDGQTVIYSAAWEGRPMQMFLRRLDSTEALPVALEPAYARVLSVSSRGEIALLIPSEPGVELLPFFITGTLARVPLTGGTPRALAEDVQDADWDSSGEQLALVRVVEGVTWLEYPPGKVLHQTSGGIGRVRVSPRDDLVAFFDYPYVNNNRGFVAVVSPGGEMRRLSAELENLDGLAWSPSGEEIWISGADDVGYALFAISLSGQMRVLRRSPAPLALHDTTSDGRVLMTQSLRHLGIAGRAPGEGAERDLSWMEASFVSDLSADGERILFMEQNQMVYDVWLRRTDGSAPTHLGPGMSFSLSPDGRWALACLPSLASPLTLLPTGAGAPRELGESTGALWGTWTPDGERVVWAAADSEGTTRLFVQDIDGGGRRAIPAEGIQTSVDRPCHVSPDGRWVAALGPDRVIKLYPLEGGDARGVPGALPGDEPSGWTEDGRGLFVWRSDSLPAQVFRIDVENGARSPWLELMPRDPAGIGGLISFVVTPDGEAYAYTYVRMLDSLYLMSGLE